MVSRLGGASEVRDGSACGPSAPWSSEAAVLVGLRCAVGLAGAFWRVFLERCLGGSGGGSPRTSLSCFRWLLCFPCWPVSCGRLGTALGALAEVLPNVASCCFGCCCSLSLGRDELLLLPGGYRDALPRCYKAIVAAPFPVVMASRRPVRARQCLWVPHVFPWPGLCVDVCPRAGCALRTIWLGTRLVASLRSVTEGDTFVAVSWQWR
ncbi:hypothetical protein Taro_037808 [Colocasia esculenta]|uniref:Uncharacterized protein n=1 Tax=Colocasia esculenta TaxID=4460 RepID=A0A843WQT5_COLES|nr:hypothetical protein [Colocasia esculenta]